MKKNPLLFSCVALSGSDGGAMRWLLSHWVGVRLVGCRYSGRSFGLVFDLVADDLWSVREFQREFALALELNGHSIELISQQLKLAL